MPRSKLDPMSMRTYHPTYSLDFQALRLLGEILQRMARSALRVKSDPRAGTTLRVGTMSI